MIQASPQLLDTSVLYSCCKLSLLSVRVSLTQASLGFLEFSVLEMEVAMQHQRKVGLGQVYP